ncbi:hypothetical protein XAP6164_3080010 [Xanthomonas phaseoli pv. phaseoli]|nr:hypothetical protein XAP6164_3080010 [Xanthomonas phaseoli pv. phaseoli]
MLMRGQPQVPIRCFKRRRGQGARTERSGHGDSVPAAQERRHRQATHDRVGRARSGVSEKWVSAVNAIAAPPASCAASGGCSG